MLMMGAGQSLLTYSGDPGLPHGNMLQPSDHLTDGLLILFFFPILFFVGSHTW